LAIGSEDKLPDVIDEKTARDFCGKCFDEGDWEVLAGKEGLLKKQTFLNTIQIRNHAPSIVTWLEFWRIDELAERFIELEVMSADDLLDISPTILQKFKDSIKSVQKKHFEKAMAHAAYLKVKPVGYMPWRPFALEMWLESWRLQRILPGLIVHGIDVKEDIPDFLEKFWPELGMRLLEEKRWREAVQNLFSLLKSFNFLAQRKAAVPTLNTWLKSLHLGALKDRLEAFGAVQLMDLDDVKDHQLKELGLNQLQQKHWHIGMNQVKAAKREAMADGYADLPDLYGFLENWRLHALYDKVTELGALTQQDLLDLEPEDFGLLKMKPLEEKRFHWMMIALEEEFEAPPPGEELTEENMTRRMWRKQQAEKDGFKQVDVDFKSKLRATDMEEDNILNQNKITKRQTKDIGKKTKRDKARETASKTQMAKTDISLDGTARSTGNRSARSEGKKSARQDTGRNTGRSSRR